MTLARTLLVGLIGVGVVAPLRPCTTFCLVDDHSVVYGRNFDYYVADGRVMVNRRGLLKSAFGTNSGLQWISRFGSLTFNQFGHEFPNGGMNEAGLVLEHMMLEGSQYPNDSRPSLSELQWIQYQLDCFASVADVLASDREIRIQPGSTGLHYLVADRTGHCAVIEFLGGQLVCHTDGLLPVAALTNDTYDASLAYEAATTPARADHVSSLGRFVQAAASVRSFAGLHVADPISYAFAALANVNQPNWTRWSIVYDLVNRTAYFRTLPAPLIKQIRLDDLDFRPAAPIRMMDINAYDGGVVTPQAIYSQQDNLAVLLSVYRQTTPLANTSSSYLERRAAYPDSVAPISRPSIGAQPISQTVAPGGSATLSAAAAGDGTLTFQWRKDGADIAGATSTTLTLGNLTAAQAGDYTVVVTNPAGSTTSRLARLTVATPEPGRLINLSVRATAGAGGQPLIVGFAVSGGAKRLVVRAVGPSLGNLFGVPGALADARLDVHQTVGVEDRIVATNDNWAANASECDALIRTCASVGAFPLATTSRDAALALDVDGARTVQASGVPSSASGIVLVEAYDAGTGNTPRLVNLSTRNQVGTGSDALIAGFVINGNVPMRLLVRGVGPSLATLFGVAGALTDPRLELHATINNQDTIIAANDNWADEPGATNAAASVAAFALPSGSKDAALVVTLPAGSYTAVLSGVNGATGNGLVEVYEL